MQALGPNSVTSHSTASYHHFVSDRLPINLSHEHSHDSHVHNHLTLNQQQQKVRPRDKA